ncbi:MAG: hypothetical protein COB36_06545 [Alphaproteobacteria bacterium]|nr:MAG: hypothetical protein COB36_06545 [Alphaproteobacteria bacterium]
MYKPTVKNLKTEHGFSLLELAIVLVLIGLVMAPAISIYHTQRIKADWEGTEKHVATSVDELGGFRSVYGRYPCPASLTATPGDINYGHQDCTVHPAGTCGGGTCTFTSNIVGQQVLTGGIPFKTLNLQESEIFDKYLNRLSYAVTLSLTDSATFDLTGGGIGIVDKSAQSIITPSNRAHFVVISHGPNQIGGTTRAGILSAACTTGTVLEQENCDIDSVFLSGDIDNDFDDRIGFFSGVAFSEWQVSQLFPTKIHLKNANSISIGATTATDLSGTEQTSIHTFSIDSGSIMASDVRNPLNEGRFHADQLCIYDADDPTDDTECFRPRRFAGNLEKDGSTTPPRYYEDATVVNPMDRSGMSCFTPGGQDEFLVGIINGEADCRPEIYISCPDGQFITGIDPSGNVQCSDAPAAKCLPQNITTTCGTTYPMPETASGVYAYRYSGQCYEIENYNAAYFTAQFAGFSTVAEATNLIDTINGADRTDVVCGATSTNSQVRDRFQCNSGSWGSPVKTHEKRYPWNNFPSNPNAGSPWPAETSYTGDDINNSNHYHDCWCREDYRASTYSCGGGRSGTRIVVRKHTCPQTAHYWSTILDSYEFCACAPYIDTVTQSCNAYYDEINNTTGTTGLTGNVRHEYNITCSGDTHVRPDDPTTTDASACACPANPDTLVRSYCPMGTTNSWTSTYGPEVGVSGIDITSWSCPGTTSNGLPDPGALDTTVSYTPAPPACTCDHALTSEKTLACAAGLEGTGMVYEREWDCIADDWEDQADWELLTNNCHACSWQSTGAPSPEEFPYGGSEHKVGKVCTCGSAPTNQCWDYGSPDYDIWTNCPCVAQIE